MDDQEVWAAELRLWKGEESAFRMIDPAARMALPAAPFIFAGDQAVNAVAATPHWTNVAFEDGTIARPQHGLIVIAYIAHAQLAAAEPYIAHCTTTYCLGEAGEWHVIQHQQSPKLALTG